MTEPPRSEERRCSLRRKRIKDACSGPTRATTDRHMADPLILFAALARGTTEYGIPRMTDHVESNLYLVEKILGAQGHCQGTHLQLEGSGFQKSLKIIS
ncbi:MAG: hypothetical protein NTY64_04630 [Deltaproteobacteria bacterium]|nr:hypothetical protein [Deltaproteobacteria bacterium]